MEIEAYDPNKVIKVEMSKVHPNSWNPKDKGHADVEKIEKSIKKHGFKQPIQVREHPTIPNEYEIIDGEQRYTAMDNLGAEFIYVFNNGKVKDEDAQNETLWWQVQVPFAPVKLATLVTDLELKGLELPYSPKELEKIKSPAVKDSATLKDQKTTISLTADQYHIVMQAVELAKDGDEDMSTGRALELICADYMAGV